MSNVDHAEIAKFEALAHRWWDRESEFKPLHDINPLRLEWIDRHCQLAGKSVLDVGCGGGLLSEAMCERGATVTGIDAGAKRIVLHDGTSLDFDSLLLASGATHAYFGNDHWAAHAPGLKTLDDALHLRRKLLLAPFPPESGKPFSLPTPGARR